VKWLFSGSAEINIDVGLDQLQPKGTKEFDNMVAGVMDRSRRPIMSSEGLCHSREVLYA
jgi:hypothetical protein